MSELANLITRLQTGINRDASYIRSIRHPQLLLQALQELQDLTGNDSVKDSVATQVSHLIMTKRRSRENPSIKEDEVMLNTVLYGPPGVGKTLVGSKLAKIWYALGFLKGSEKNPTNKKVDIKELLKDALKENSGKSEEDPSFFLYACFSVGMILIAVLSMSWRFYQQFGGYWTAMAAAVLLAAVAALFWYATRQTEGSSVDQFQQSDLPLNVKERVINPTDDDIIRVVSRADLVGRYVGWTSQQVNKVLTESLGKVLFIDEAYSLVTDPHDSFGIEAATTLNLFLSQHPGEIIVIFAGYGDLLNNGVFAVQPGLKRRFMWNFDCNGYTPDQLFSIFQLQLKKTGWGLTDSEATAPLFQQYSDSFPAFGGDTERLTFLSKLEHSKQYMTNEKGMSCNLLTPDNVRLGIEKLRANTIRDSDSPSTNPLANVMRLLQGGEQSRR